MVHLYIFFKIHLINRSFNYFFKYMNTFFLLLAFCILRNSIYSNKFLKIVFLKKTITWFSSRLIKQSIGER